MPEREPENSIGNRASGRSIADRGEVAGLFWDAEVGARQIRRLLREGDELSRRAVVRRLLEFGEWDEILAFLSLDDIERELPYVSFRSPEIESFWKEAVAFWRAQPQ